MTTQQILETSGETIEAAVQQGLAILGLARDAVEIEVLDEGRSGFLGMGHRDASVRLTVKGSGSATSEPAPAETKPEAAQVAEPTAVATTTTTPDVGFDVLDDLEDLPDPELLEEEETAQYIVAQHIEKLGLDAHVDSDLSERDDLGKQVVELDIDGEDLGELIGRRGETLNSLQYLSRLMVSQQLRRRVNFQIDVNGFRQQREDGLARLAARMADKVVRRGQSVTLEPMSAYERRLIHVHLRDNTAVTTRSIGQGDSRRVQIHPAGQDTEADDGGQNKRSSRRSRRR